MNFDYCSYAVICIIIPSMGAIYGHVELLVTTHNPELNPLLAHICRCNRFMTFVSSFCFNIFSLQGVCARIHLNFSIFPFNTIWSSEHMALKCCIDANTCCRKKTNFMRDLSQQILWNPISDVMSQHVFV